MGEAAFHPRRHGDAVLTGHFREGSDYATTRRHGSDDWLVILTLAGSGRIAWSAGSMETRPGDLVLWRPGSPHDYRTASGRWELAWAHIDLPDAWIELIAWPEAAPGVHHLHLDGQDRAAAAAALAAADRAARGTGALAQRRALHALEGLFLVCADRAGIDGGPRDAAIHEAMELITGDLRRGWSVAALARRVGLSPSRFAHRFRAAAGDSPQRWSEAARLRRAARLLEGTALPIAAIAAQVGYADPLHFSRRFHARMDRSPRAWRGMGVRERKPGR